MATNAATLGVLKGGGAASASSPVSFLFLSLAILAAASAAFALSAGADLTQALPTSAACLAILVFGLPHGSLDLELLSNGAAASRSTLIPLLTAYIALALATYALWAASPVLALLLFLVVSIIHFAEDWSACRSAMLAHALALATIAAPVLLHRAAIASLFATLAGDSRAAVLAQLLVLIAPMAVASALAACAALWHNGMRTLAVAAAVSVGAMLFLPPVIGFAIYFCLLHSPTHLRESVTRVLAQSRAPDRMVRTVLIMVALTLASLGIAAALFGVNTGFGVPDRLFSATFLTLSVLTVPHMLMPQLVGVIIPAPSPGKSAA